MGSGQSRRKLAIAQARINHLEQQLSEQREVPLQQATAFRDSALKVTHQLSTGNKKLEQKLALALQKLTDAVRSCSEQLKQTRSQSDSHNIPAECPRCASPLSIK